MSASPGNEPKRQGVHVLRLIPVLPSTLDINHVDEQRGIFISWSEPNQLWTVWEPLQGHEQD